MSNRTSVPSYLIVCFRFIGDVLVTTPLALSIKTAYPDAVVDYLVFKGTEGILAKNPHIRNVITVPRGSSGLGVLISLFRKYDIAIAAYPSDRTALAAAIAGKLSVGLSYGLKKEWWKGLVLDIQQVCYDRIHVVSNILMTLWRLGIEPVPRVVMGYDENDIAFARNAVPIERYVILHPYSMKVYKYWPAEQWARLAKIIQEQTDCIPVFTRTPDAEGSEYLERIRKTSPQGTKVFDAAFTLNQLAAIVKGAAAFVGIDTAITHMAAALDTPTVAIFGPTWTRYWAPWPNDSLNPSPFVENKGVQRKNYITVIQKNWQCVPCNMETCQISKRGVMECLEELTAEEVFVELEGLIMNQLKGHYFTDSRQHLSRCVGY
jgi:heptosyltransferase-3